jgi:hypothetical protein
MLNDVAFPPVVRFSLGMLFVVNLAAKMRSEIYQLWKTFSMLFMGRSYFSSER